MGAAPDEGSLPDAIQAHDQKELGGQTIEECGICWRGCAITHDAGSYLKKPEG